MQPSTFLRKALFSLPVLAALAVHGAGQCPTASATHGWVNTSFATQMGTFTATFDATPSLSNMNSVVGLSHGAGAGYADFANLVAFNGTLGIILARNAALYDGPKTTIPYSGGNTYHFRLVIKLSTHTYSIFVTPPSGSELTVGSDFQFRSEQSTVTSLNNLGVFVGASTGSLAVCSFAVSSGSGGTPDFSLSVPPPVSQTITAGGSTTYSVNVGALNGFTGNVTLGISGLPTGATGTFNPNPVSNSGASTLTVSTNATTQANTYSLVITGTNGSLSHSANVTLNVNPVATPDFMLSASPASQTISPGNNANFTVTVMPQNGFGGNVAFSVAGLPAGAAAGFAPTSVTGAGSSTLTVSTTSSTAISNNTLAITGDSDSLSHSTSVALNISTAQTVLNVRDFGATGNGTTLDTAAFQRALDACATHSACTVNVPTGTYLIGSIVLSSNTTLNVEPGAKVQGSNNAADYPIITVRWEGRLASGHRGLIYASGAQNIAIQGGGTIAGGATVGALRNPRGPVLIEPSNCTNVTIDSMHLTNHSVWTVHPVFDTNVTITNTTITTSGGNSDGIDPDSTMHMLIDHDTINTGDDAIAIKSGRGEEGFTMAKPSGDITISNSSMTTGFGCVTLGSEMSGGIDGVTIRNITCGPRAEAAVKFKAPIGRGAFIRNIDAQGIDSLGSFMIRFTLSQGKTDSNPVPGLAGVPQLSNISVTNSTIHGGTLADMVGWTQKPTDGITIANITGTCSHGVNIANAVHVNVDPATLHVTGFTPPLITLTNVH
jgi:polygalacturonase